MICSKRECFLWRRDVGPFVALRSLPKLGEFRKSHEVGRLDGVGSNSQELYTPLGGIADPPPGLLHQLGLAEISERPHHPVEPFRLTAWNRFELVLVGELQRLGGMFCRVLPVDPRVCDNHFQGRSNEVVKLRCCHAKKYGRCARVFAVSDERPLNGRWPCGKDNLPCTATASPFHMELDSADDVAYCSSNYSV